MTSPAASHLLHVDGLIIADRCPVLQRRELLPETDPAELPCFGDDRWDLSAAVPDRHSAGQAIHWDIYPAPLRNATKIYVFALVNVVTGAPRLPHARSAVPGIKTIWSDLVYLRVFLHWLVDHRVESFDHVRGEHLLRYLAHIQDQSGVSTAWKRKTLAAVQRLHAYRDVLPATDRLPERRLWGGASAAELAGDPGPRLGENRTPRIHPAVMEPLLSAAMLVIDAIAADLVPAAQQLIRIRALAHRAGGAMPRTDTSRWQSTVERLERIVTAMVTAGQHLPGRTGRLGRLEVDLTGLAIATGLERSVLDKGTCRRILADSRLLLTRDMMRTTMFTPIDGRPWRTEPVEADELLVLLRHLSTASFLAVAYLSGIRTGEVLNLRRGCITRDPTLNLIFLSGQQMKAGPERRERSPKTVPWVVIEPAAQAVALLEQLAPGAVLFPPGEVATPTWIENADTRSRTPGTINSDITAFIDWFNDHLAPTIGHPPIPATGTARSPRLGCVGPWSGTSCGAPAGPSPAPPSTATCTPRSPRATPAGPTPVSSTRSASRTSCCAPNTSTPTSNASSRASTCPGRPRTPIATELRPTRLSPGPRSPRPRSCARPARIRTCRSTTAICSPAFGDPTPQPAPPQARTVLPGHVVARTAATSRAPTAT